MAGHRLGRLLPRLLAGLSPSERPTLSQASQVATALSSLQPPSLGDSWPPPSSGRTPSAPWQVAMQAFSSQASRLPQHTTIPNRKPAIKRPAPHQWHYCNIDYVPGSPPPKNPLPPWAPDKAYLKDYKAIFLKTRPWRGTNRCDIDPVGSMTTSPVSALQCR